MKMRTQFAQWTCVLKVILWLQPGVVFIYSSLMYPQIALAVKVQDKNDSQNAQVRYETSMKKPTLILLTKKIQVKESVVTIKGAFKNPDWSLIVNEDSIPIKQKRFSVVIPIKEPKTVMKTTAIGPYGEVELGQFIIDYKPETIKTKWYKRLAFGAQLGVNYTLGSYQQKISGQQVKISGGLGLPVIGAHVQFPCDPVPVFRQLAFSMKGFVEYQSFHREVAALPTGVDQSKVPSTTFAVISLQALAIGHWKGFYSGIGGGLGLSLSSLTLGGWGTLAGGYRLGKVFLESRVQVDVLSNVRLKTVPFFLTIGLTY